MNNFLKNGVFNYNSFCDSKSDVLYELHKSDYRKLLYFEKYFQQVLLIMIKNSILIKNSNHSK
jgi:hypothetical protein